MLPYTIDGVALSQPEGAIHRDVIVRAMDSQIAARKVTVESDFCTDADNYADLAVAYANANAVVRARRRHAQEDRDAQAEKDAPPPPTGFYYLGRGGEVEAWSKTHRDRRPETVDIVDRLRKAIELAPRPVSVAHMLVFWGANCAALKALIGVGFLVEASEAECDLAVGYKWREERQAALGARAEVMRQTDLLPSAPSLAVEDGGNAEA